MYIYTGGEPMVRKRDLITLCERHPDCEFLSFTNGTLIDEEFCMEMLRVKISSRRLVWRDLKKQMMDAGAKGF